MKNDKKKWKPEDIKPGLVYFIRCYENNKQSYFNIVVCAIDIDYVSVYCGHQSVRRIVPRVSKWSISEGLKEEDGLKYITG